MSRARSREAEGMAKRPGVRLRAVLRISCPVPLVRRLLLLLSSSSSAAASTTNPALEELFSRSQPTTVQEGSPDELCSPLIDAKNKWDKLIARHIMNHMEIMNHIRRSLTW